MKKNTEGADWNIRQAEPGDRQRIETIAGESYAIYIPRMDRKPFPMLDDYAVHIAAGHVFVLEDAGGVQGYVVLLPQEDGDLLLDNVAVSDSRRGRGYGRALVAFAEERARKSGSRRIRLYTNEAMRENLSLYPHLGYVESHRALDKGYNRVFFVKELVQP